MPCPALSGDGGPQGSFSLSPPPFPVSPAVPRSSPITLAPSRSGRPGSIVDLSAESTRAVCVTRARRPRVRMELRILCFLNGRGGAHTRASLQSSSASWKLDPLEPQNLSQILEALDYGTSESWLFEMKTLRIRSDLRSHLIQISNQPYVAPLQTPWTPQGQGLTLQPRRAGLRLQSGHKAALRLLVVMIDPQAHTSGAGSSDRQLGGR